MEDLSPEQFTEESVAEAPKEDVQAPVTVKSQRDIARQAMVHTFYALNGGPGLTHDEQLERLTAAGEALKVAQEAIGTAKQIVEARKTTAA